ncbi:MAG: FG-GAP-like repeat-containing protein [Planctomycetota bacterium]|nr:FG-GAP-like repeat-containing protein [Planctomycetota bacterium]
MIRACAIGLVGMASTFLLFHSPLEALPLAGSITLDSVSTDVVEVYPGAMGLKVTFTVFNDTGHTITIKCGSTETFPKFKEFSSGNDAAADYSFTTDVCPGSDIPDMQTGTVSFWVSATASSPPSFLGDITIDGKVTAKKAVGGGPTWSDAGATTTDLWTMFDIFYSAFGDVKASSSTIDDEQCNAEFGAAVALGDVTDDTTGDSVVGAPLYDTNAGGSTQTDAGAVYVFPNNRGCVGEDIWSTKLTNSIAGENFGAAVAMGDFWDNDGDDDLIIGAPGFSSDKGRVYTFRSDGDGTFSTSGTYVMGCSGGGDQDDARFGLSLALADVVGDSDLDLIIGIPGGGDLSTCSPSTHPGLVSVREGDGAGGFNGGGLPDGGILESGDPEDGGEFGYSVAAGDTDGNGTIDIVVGAPGEDCDDGVVYIYEFTASTLTRIATITDSNSTAEERFGTSVAVGDMDDDGSADLVIGAPEWKATTVTYQSGKVTLVFDPVDSPFARDFSDPFLENEGKFGWSVAMGNIDKDSSGKMDVVIGSPGASPAHWTEQKSEGEIFVILNPTETGDLEIRYLFHSLNEAHPLEAAEFGRAVAVGEISSPTSCSSEWEILVGEPHGGDNPSGCGSTVREGSVRILQVD